MIRPAMNQLPDRRLGSRLLRAAVLASVVSLPSCATFTGFLTGAFTGIVDLPTEIITENRLPLDGSGTWVVALFAAPVGFAFGPAFGFIKGFGIDVNTAVGNVTRADAFGTYDRVSIWRPYAFEWETKR